MDGVSFVQKMMEQMEKLGVQPILDQVVEVNRVEERFVVKTLSGMEYGAKTLLFCTGAEHKRLEVPGEREYTGRGRVVVVGGGNSGFEAAEQLINYAREIYLVRERVLQNPKVKPLLRHRVLEIRGDGGNVRSVILEDMERGRVFQLEVEGVFVEVGLKPNSELAKSLGVLTTQFAKQIITAADDGAKALLSIYHDLTYGVSSWI